MALPAMAVLFDRHDWAATPLGPRADWPPALRTIVLLMLNSRQPMFLAWGPSLCFLYNDAYAPILGGRHGVALGQPFRTVWPEIWDDIAPLVETALAGEAVWLENLPLTMHRHGFAEETWYTFSYSPAHDDGGAVAGVFCSCIETTAQILAERQGASERAQQRLMLQQMPGFVAMLAGPDHRFEYANDAYRALVGGRAVIGRSVAEALPEVTGQGFVHLLDRVFATGSAHVARAQPVRLAQPDGERFVDFLYFPIRDDIGTITGIFVGGYDVTDAVTVREALRADRDRLGALLAGMNECFALLDGDYRVRDINDEALRREGRPRAAVIGNSLWDLWPDAADGELGALFRRAIAARQPMALTHRMAGPAGAAAWLDLRAYPVADGLALFWKDITDQRRAAQALAESERKYRTLFEAIDAGFCIIEMIFDDRDRPCDYRFLETNPAFARQSGLDDVVGRRVRELVPQHEQRWFDLYGDVALTGRPARIEDGSDALGRIWDVHAFRIGDPNQHRVAVLFSDITERRRTELTARAALERIQLALEAGALVGTWVWDLVTGLFTGDDRFARSFGLDAEHCRQGLDIAAVIASVHPDDRVRVAEANAAAMAGGPFRCEYRVCNAEGDYRWIEAHGRVELDADGRPLRFPGVLVDVHERRATEDRLRAQAEEIAVIFDAVPAALWVTRDSSAQVITGNRRAAELLGVPDTETNMSKSAPDTEAVAHLEIQDAAGNPLPPEALPVQRAARGEMVRNFEERLLFADGRLVELIGNAAPLYEPDGRVRGAVAAFIDISARKAAERQLAALNLQLQDANERLADEVAAAVSAREIALAQLHEAQKIETLGQLTGGVAHDFNNLLTPIMGGLDFAARRLADDPRGHRLLAAAMQSAERARTLVQRLLAFGRRQTLQARALDLAALVAGMAELIRRSVGPAITLDIAIPATLPAVLIDPNQFELALLNLCVNARDAMSERGSIRITAATLDDPPGLAPGRYVALTVADTGQGMDPETIQRATEPFFTTKGVGQGTGLGLSMVQGLAAQSGGELRLDSTPGCGTRVTLVMPSAGTGPETPEAVTVPDLLPGRGWLLVVDDEPLVRAALAEELAEAGYIVALAASADDALARLAVGPLPDLVVTDHMMPGMTGIELAAALEQRHPGLPVLLMTGFANLPPGLGDRIALLHKPFRPGEMAARIAGLLTPAA